MLVVIRFFFGCTLVATAFFFFVCTWVATQTSPVAGMLQLVDTQRTEQKKSRKK
jgi:hypothetical protein